MNGTGIQGHIGAETVPPVGDIPTEPKAFERWLVEQDCYTAWPAELTRAGQRALNALTARASEGWPFSVEETRRHRGNWSAFTTALAAYRAEAV